MTTEERTQSGISIDSVVARSCRCSHAVHARLIVLDMLNFTQRNIREAPRKQNARTTAIHYSAVRIPSCVASHEANENMKSPLPCMVRPSILAHGDRRLLVK